MEKCKNCKYWKRDAKQEDIGQCRIDPPKVFPMPSKLGGMGSISTWPSTNPEDWCGKQQPKLE